MKKVIRIAITVILVIVVIISSLFGSMHALDKMVITGILASFIQSEEEKARERVEADRQGWYDNWGDRWGYGGDGNYVLVPGLYPSDPVLRIKAQILELAIEIGGKVGVAPEDLFVAFYAEHGCELHFESNYASIYTDLSCVSGGCDYSSYFGNDPKNGTPSKDASISYGPFGFKGDKLDSEMKYYYDAEQAGGGGKAYDASGVMKHTSTITDFKRPNPLYFPDAMYNMAMKMKNGAEGDNKEVEDDAVDDDVKEPIKNSESNGEGNNQKEQETGDVRVIRNVTDLSSIDFERVDTRCASGLTVEELNDVIEFKTKYRPNSRLKGQGKAFLEAEAQTGVNALFWIALSCQETGLGDPDTCSIVKKNNFFSYGATDNNTYNNAHSYSDIIAGVVGGAKEIAHDYINNTKYPQYTLRRMTDPPPVEGYGWHRYNAYDSWSPAIATIWEECCRRVIKNGGEIKLGSQVFNSPGVGGDISLGNGANAKKLGYTDEQITQGHLIYQQWYNEVINALIAEGKLGSGGSNAGGGFDLNGDGVPDGNGGNGGAEGNVGIGGSGTKLTQQQQETIRSIALEQVGKPYNRGGKGPNEFDCSGLVYYVFNTRLNLGFNAPAVNGKLSAGMASICTDVSWDELEVGDLIFKTGEVGNKGAVHHVILYIGNGQAVEAYDYGVGVIITPVSELREKPNAFCGRPNIFYQANSGGNYGGNITANTGAITTNAGYGGLPGSQFPIKLSSVTSFSSQFGYRYADGSNLHKAIDLAAPRNTPLYPVVDGMTVELVNYSTGGYGYQVVMSTVYKGTKIYVRYNHMNSASPCKKGQIVNKSDVVGYVGGSSGQGFEYGMHLDWEVFIGTLEPQSGSSYKSHPFELVGFKPYADIEWRQEWLKTVGLLNKMECDGACKLTSVWEKACKAGYYQFLCSSHDTADNRAKHKQIEDKYNTKVKSIWDL